MAKWSEIPVTAKAGVIAGVALAITVVLYFAAFKSTMDENKRNADLLAAKNAENSRLKTQYEPRLADVNRRVEMLKQQLEIQKRIVPDEKEAPAFIRLMQDKAIAAGVEVRRYTAKPIAKHEFYTEVPFEMELDGPYFSLLTFFEDVGKMERIINISGLNMAGLKTQKNVIKKQYTFAPGETVGIICTATTFFSHDADAQAAAAAAAAATKK